MEGGKALFALAPAQGFPCWCKPSSSAAWLGARAAVRSLHPCSKLVGGGGLDLTVRLGELLLAAETTQATAGAELEVKPGVNTSSKSATEPVSRGQARASFISASPVC